MALKDLIRQVHGPSDVIPLLDVFLRQREQRPDGRKGGWHPSQFCGMCPRQDVLAKILDLPSEEASGLEPRVLRIFDNGTALHEWYQNRYLGPMGILWGGWECSRCHHVEWGFMPKKRHEGCHDKRCAELCQTDADFDGRGGCVHCGIWGSWRYVEVDLHLVQRTTSISGKPLEVEINGHCDGLILLGREWLILEMKTINDRGFGMLPSPHDSHVKQMQTYMKLIRHSPRVTREMWPKSGLVLYINKNNSDLKEFKIPEDTAFQDRIILAPVHYEESLVEGNLPPRLTECTSMMVKKAKACPMVSYCFGGKTFKELDQRGTR